MTKTKPDIDKFNIFSLILGGIFMIIYVSVENIYGFLIGFWLTIIVLCSQIIDYLKMVNENILELNGEKR